MRKLSVLVLGMIVPILSMSAPVAMVGSDDMQIVLTDEDCAMKEVIANLPKRAVWTDKGHSYEGCWGIHPQTQIVSLYFDDKTVAAIPAQAFKRVSET